MQTAGARSSVNVDLYGGSPSAASFDLTGESGAIYSITLPSSATLTSGANTMTVDTYKALRSRKVVTLKQSRGRARWLP